MHTVRIQFFFLNKELENIKNNEIELKNTITEMKSTLEGICSRLNEEEWITELEDRVVEITMAEQKKAKKVKRNEDSLRDLWDNIKSDHIHIIGVPEGEERDKGPEKISEEVIAETLPNWARK